MRPWNGIRDAVEFGPASIQEPMLGNAYPFGPISAMSEGCLTLNVWTPVGAVGRPVIVWLHGGGYRMGSSSMPAYDGRIYAEIGRVVMVSINYRLGVLGFAAHEAFKDPETGACANWAVQDQIQALRWIKANVAEFGGNPDRITVMGESGGAINAIMIANSLGSGSPFNQVIAMSPPYICPPATLALDDWRNVIETIATEFGTSVEGLRHVPATALHEAEWRQYRENALTTETGRAYRGTAVDGVVLQQWPAFHALPRMPMIIGCTGAEGAMGYNCYHPVTKQLISRCRPADDTAARAETRNMLDRLYYLAGRSTTVDEVVTRYRDCALADDRRDDMISLLVELFGDVMIRHYCVRKAEQIVRSGFEHVYFYHYALPVPAPNHGPPHAWELPVAFGNHRNPLIAPWVGDGALQNSVSAAIVESFSSFAEKGRPSSTLLPPWPGFQAGGENVMVLGEGGAIGKIGGMPKYRQLGVLDELAALSP